MPPKRLNPLENPPTASSSSSDDEVETSTGEEEEIDGYSSEEEKEVSANLNVKKPETAPPVESAKKQVSDSESDSGTESDSESEIEKKEVKSVKVNNGAVKNRDFEISKSSVKSPSKRPSEVDETPKSVKRAKTGREETEKKIGSETKKPSFLRVWKEDDEIALLQGFFEFKNEFGITPYHDMNGFYQFVKNSLSFDASKTQFTEKIRALKKKYENNRGKNVEEQTFTKSHDCKAFELSKGIWGADGMGLESAVKSNGKSKKSTKKKAESVKQEPCSPNGKMQEEDRKMVTNEREVSPFGVTKVDTSENSSFVDSVVQSVVSIGVDDLAARQGWNMMAAENKKKLEERWKTLQRKEFEFYTEKSSFVHEVMAKITEAFRSNS